MEYSLPGIYFVVENKTEFDKAFGSDVDTIGIAGDGCSLSETTDGKMVIKDRKLGGLVEGDEEGKVPIAASVAAWEKIKKMAELERLGFVTSYSPDSAELEALMPQDMELSEKK